MMRLWFITLILRQKKQTVQWKHPGSSSPKKIKRVSSAGKVMTIISWDGQGVIMMHYLEEDRTINGEYYTHHENMYIILTPLNPTFI